MSNFKVQGNLIANNTSTNTLVSLSSLSVNEILKFTLVNTTSSFSELYNDNSFNWCDISTNSSGKYQLLAASGAQKVIVSNDYGTTWKNANIGTDLHYTGTAMSSNGQYMYLAPGSGDPINWVYKSSNYGVTWTDTLQLTLNSTRINKIRCSNDGSLVVALVAEGLYISTDYAVNWGSVNTTLANAKDIAISSNGQYITVITDSNIYQSNNYGSSFTDYIQLQPAGVWTGIAMSSNGKYQAITDFVDNSPDTGQIYVSDDFGSTWTARGVSEGWLNVAVSSDGKDLYASKSVNSGNLKTLYYSDDYGVSWNASNLTSKDIRDISISNDKNYVLVAVNTDGVYSKNGYIKIDGKLTSESLTLIHPTSTITFSNVVTSTSNATFTSPAEYIIIYVNNVQRLIPLYTI